MKTTSCLFLSLLLTACASNPQVYDKPRDAISAELAAAARAPAERPAGTLYPSLRLDMPEPVAAPREPRFDLVVNDAPARQVFLSIVADTSYSMLLPADLEGRITVSLKNVTMSEALSSLRQLYGYEYRVEGQRIFIQSRAMQTRIMKVNYLNAVRRGASDIRVISGSVSDSTSSGQNGGSTSQSNFVTSKISTSSQSDFWSELQAAVKSIIGAGEGRSVVISPQSGVLVVRALPGEIGQVEQFLRASQLALERQVIIEAKIIEVALNSQFQAGINWAAFGSGNAPGGYGQFSIGQLTPGSSLARSGTVSTGPVSGSAQVDLGNAADAAGAMFGMVLRTANFAAVLNLLEEQGRVHVLSSPRVATLNNQKAVLKVGNDDFFVTEVSTNSSTNTNGSQNVSPKLTLQPFFSGIALDVTPQIDDSDQITLHVHPMVSRVTSVTQEIDLGTLGNFKLPLASSQISEMDSVVRALDGQMVVLGGLIRQASSNTDGQLPGLGEVPLLGNLFKQQARDSERRELVILLRPTIVQTPADWSEDIGQSQQRVQRLLDERGRPRP